MKQLPLFISGRSTPLRIGAAIFLLIITLVAPLLLSAPGSAAMLAYRSLQLSDGAAAATGVRYNFGFNTNTSASIGSIRFEICSNYQYEPTDSCTAPNGLDASGATLSNQTGLTNFSYNAASDSNTLVISRPAATPVTPQPLSFEFSNITNPQDVGSYYVRVSTYVTTDGSGPETDYGIVVFATNLGIGISTEVPPYLLFCTGITIDGYDCETAQGSYINFGELSSKATRTATSQMLASTNAAYGYSVTLAGTTMTAGTNVIPALSGGSSQVGASQFGINGRQNSAPSVGGEPNGPGLTMPRAGYDTPNQYRFAAGDIVASTNTTDDYRKMTMSYIVNTKAGQPPGLYVATVSYICLANF